MNKYNPFKGTFELNKLIDKIANRILYLSTLLLIINFVINNYFPNYLSLASNIIKINCFFILSYATLSFFTDYYFYQASVNRRRDFIDNSFDCLYSENKSINYYTNDNIVYGIYKMAVNNFENTMFTYEISKKMTIKIWFKNIVFVIVTILLAIYGFNNILILIIQLTLPVMLLEKAIKHSLFVNRVYNVYEKNRRLFNDLRKSDNTEYKNPEILLNILEYEAAISSGTVLLDSKIFDKMNSNLSTKWNDIKNEYRINIST